MTKNETHNKFAPLTHHTHTNTNYIHYTHLSHDIYRWGGTQKFPESFKKFI